MICAQSSFVKQPDHLIHRVVTINRRPIRVRAGVQNSSEEIPFPSDSHELGLDLPLHDMLEKAGVNVNLARAGRCNFVKELRRIQTSECSTNPAPEINLAKAALEISAEDDALVSHSPVPLPVDAFIGRLDHMANEFALHHLPRVSSRRNPQDVFDCMDRYIYGLQGFGRAPLASRTDARDLYLNGVLTRKTGSPVMLALIYFELAQRVERLGALDFSVEIQIPLDPIALPQPAIRAPGGSTPCPRGLVPLSPNLMLYEILRGLKELYWPWRWHRGSSSGSGFMEAASANSQGLGLGIMGPSAGPASSLSSQSGAEIAAARAARYRLQRGIWTNAGFGDLRRALAACERLVLLGLDDKDLRDYGVLLFHCGKYELAHSYLTLYSKKREMSKAERFSFNPLGEREDDALNNLLGRVQLILLESSWSRVATQATFEQLPEPW